MIGKLTFAALLSAMLSTATDDNRIAISDLTPKFLTFYRTAIADRLTGDARFALWKKDYGFAAVPPGPDGDKIARQLLDEAWPRYAAALPQIERGARGLQPSPNPTLQRVETLLRPSRPTRMKLIVYVGGFEGNAFTVGQKGIPTVAIPVEMSAQQRGPVMTHEFVHAVQISMGSMSGGWERSIGETVLAEGLAMRATQRLYPNLPSTRFVETPDEPGWLAKAERRRPRILSDIRKVVRSSTSDDVLKFTMGTGPAGIDREAYYAGWVVVGYWLAHGLNYGEIARIPESEAPERVARAIDAIEKTQRGSSPN